MVSSVAKGKESACNAGATGDVVQSLRREDSLEEGMATTPVFLPGESHGQNPMDSWAIVHGVTKSGT